MKSRYLAISAVNLIEGGTLTILREFVAAACEMLPSEWTIIVFVHDRRLLDLRRPQFIELPAAKRSWLRRVYTEWIVLRRFARTFKPELWISLHDMTPNVGPIRQAVYCHNPMPFYRLRPRDIWLEPKSVPFRFFYGIVMRVNIKRNFAVIVQQCWMREKMKKWVGANTRIIVAHPVDGTQPIGTQDVNHGDGARVTFLYPSLPRIFKNAELICRAVQRLESDPGWRSVVLLTISPTENRYARWLHRSFGHLRTIQFAGRQNAAEMQATYAATDCLIFPSLLETWGLPISEAKRFGLPMFVADLPYAHEAVGDYDRVDFINVHDASSLATKMMAFQNNRAAFSGAAGTVPAAPFASNWRVLLEILLADTSCGEP